MDWVSITPPVLAYGASNPVVVTAQITDEALIRSSLNLLYVPKNGTPQIIGPLNDDGVNGDLVAGDRIFTIVSSSLAHLPIGLDNLAISAAFAGTLVRTQSALSIDIVPQAQTSGWLSMSDSQNVFSIKLPSTWNLKTTESAGDAPGEIKDVDFEFPDGTSVFSISVYTPGAWASLQSQDGPLPAYLGQNSKYVFGESDHQDPITGQSVTEDVILQLMPQVMATFKAN